MIRRWSWGWALAGLLFGCDGNSSAVRSGAPTGCAPAGVARDCRCADGTMSQEVCKADRTFAPCACGADAATPVADSGQVAADTGALDASEPADTGDGPPPDTGVVGNRAPAIADLSSSMAAMTANETVTFNALLADPDGVADIVGGVLRSDTGTTYGAFSGSGANWSMSATWSEINQILPIEFVVDETRRFHAEFFDLAGASAMANVDLRLHCRGAGACDGVCTNVMDDRTNCGACNTTCAANRECCTGSCRDLLIDNDNCGTCGITCTSSGTAALVCSGGGCVPRCPTTCDSNRGHQDCRLCPGMTRCVIDQYGGGVRFGACAR